MNTRINKWRLWSGIASAALGVIGYFYIVGLLLAGKIPIDMDLMSDLDALMESMQSGTIDESFVLLGCSGTVMEMLFIAGIVGIITHKKRWFWNIPVALILGYGAFYGFMGYKAAYPWCIWAAICLFMSIVAMRSGRRAEREQREAASQPQQEPVSPPSPGMGAWQRPQASQAPQPPQYTPAAPQAAPAPAAPVAEPQPEPQPQSEPESEPEPEYTMPPQARPIEDDEF